MYKYYNKAKLYYKYTFFIFIWIILFSQVYKLINPIIAAILMVFPFLAEYVIVPIGLRFVIKSYISKEPFHRYRLLYLIGFLFFLLLEIGFLIAIAGDIKHFSSK